MDNQIPSSLQDDVLSLAAELRKKYGLQIEVIHAGEGGLEPDSDFISVSAKFEESISQLKASLVGIEPLNNARVSVSRAKNQTILDLVFDSPHLAASLGIAVLATIVFTVAAWALRDSPNVVTVAVGQGGFLTVLLGLSSYLAATARKNELAVLAARKEKELAVLRAETEHRALIERRRTLMALIDALGVGGEMDAASKARVLQAIGETLD